MKRTHRPDLFCWSRFDEARDMDFNGYAWLRAGGSVLIDPLPLSDHDRAQVERAGPVAWIVVTNSDHTRAASNLAKQLGASLAGPAAEQASFPFACDRWLRDGDELISGLRVLELQGSKTPGELALVLEGTTLITGDLVRAPAGGGLRILPDDKLRDRAAAVASVRRLAEHGELAAVMVGDGWPVFRDGHARLRELASSL